MVSKYYTNENISATATIPETNTSSIQSLYTRISNHKLKPFLAPTEISEADVNINTLGFCEKSRDFTITGIRLKNKKYYKDEELALDKCIFSVDRVGLAVIKVIHQLCMPVFCHDPESFFKYLLEVYLTEIRISRFFCDNVDKRRELFVRSYFNHLKKGDQGPMEVFKYLMDTNKEFQGSNVKEFFESKKKNAKKYSKNQNNKDQNTKKSNGKNDSSNSSKG